MTRRILHLDMDAFFASVEILDNPALAGRPVIVGGSGARSVVCACSYEARRYGVRSAMPMRRARELCPGAEFIRPRMARYAALSDGIFEYLRGQAPLVEQTSIDEGYLDISETVPSDAAALELGRRLKNEIRHRFGLTCSVGIAPCKFIAKIASDLRKPDALVLVTAAKMEDFLAPLEVGRIPGVGRVGEKKLHALGVRTIAELRRQSRDVLTALFGKWGARLHDLARGIDPRPVETEYEVKSLGAEHTFETDVRDVAQLGRALAGQARQVATRLSEQGLAAMTVAVKVRYGDFREASRQRTFERPLQETDEIAEVARDLLRRTQAGRRPVRLVGLSVSRLVGRKGQGELPLFGPRPS